MPTHDDSGKTDAEQYVDRLDRELQPGDVAYDKNSGSWVQVVGIVADSVDAYDDRNGGRDLLTYAGNQLTDCDLSDRVVAAVHLNKNTTKSAGSGSVYDFPEGRLVRFVHETADDDLTRVQDELRDAVLSDLLATVETVDDGDQRTPQALLKQAVNRLWGQEVTHAVQELAQVKMASTGDDGDGDL